MTISIAGAPDGVQRTIPLLDLATDEAKAFLLALRDGVSPILIADGRTGFQIEFAIAEGGAGLTVSNPGQGHTPRTFTVGSRDDLATMAAHLLADLGP